MAIRTVPLKGEQSFRGCGFVRIDNILYPVCGSRRFNLSTQSKVEYIPEFIEQVAPEENRAAMFPVYITCDLGSGDAEARLSPDGVSTSGKVVMRTGHQENIPQGLIFENVSYENWRPRAPFRWALAASGLNEVPADSLATDPRPRGRLVDQFSPAHIPANFDAVLHNSFFTEIWIP